MLFVPTITYRNLIIKCIRSICEQFRCLIIIGMISFFIHLFWQALRFNTSPKPIGSQGYHWTRNIIKTSRLSTEIRDKIVQKCKPGFGQTLYWNQPTRKLVTSWLQLLSSGLKSVFKFNLWHCLMERDRKNTLVKEIFHKLVDKGQMRPNIKDNSKSEVNLPPPRMPSKQGSMVVTEAWFGDVVSFKKWETGQS